MAVTITRTAWIDDDGTGTTGTVINNAVKTDLYNQIDTALAKVAQLTGGNNFNGNQVINAGALQLGQPPGFFELIGVSWDGSGGAPAIAQKNLSPANNGQYQWFINSAGGGAGAIAQTGALTVSFTTSSDARLKDDLGHATDLEALRAVRVHDFTWKADGVRDRGIFAQDAHALYPRAVFPGSDQTTETGALARPWMTDYSKFVPDLIVGWQQHDAAIAELRAALAAVKGSANA
jgi:hypothetical protein